MSFPPFDLRPLREPALPFARWTAFHRELRHRLWTEFERLESAGLGVRRDERHGVLKFVVNWSLPEASGLQEAPQNGTGLIRSNRTGVWFSDPSPMLRSVVPKSLMAKAITTPRTVRFPWDELAEPDIRAIVDCVLAAARTLGIQGVPTGAVDHTKEGLPNDGLGEASGVGALPSEKMGKEGPGFREGRRVTVEERRAVERRAVEVTGASWRANGWEVEDVGSSECYDLRCRKGGVEVHVEVKGTTGRGEKVVLTRNEVAHARSFPNVVLSVVTGIELIVEGADNPSAVSGTMTEFNPWVIDEDALDPLEYEYSVPRDVEPRC